jgi:Helix-turn-helix domain
MSSEEETSAPRAAADRGGDGPDATAGERRTLPPPNDRRARQLQVNDPAMMRALAHPLRWALLEALLHAGTLTATQASEMLGESPANCAFHLRTLARYGLVEEAGGGKGRERPWRRSITGLNMDDRQEDPQAAAAAGVLNEFWTNLTLDRARNALLNHSSWPDGWRDALGSSQSIRYLTVAEAEEIQAELMAVLDRFDERNDNPSTRPPDALPIEYLILNYPLMNLLSRAVPESDSTDSTSD